jgi:hypothetical protein
VTPGAVRSSAVAGSLLIYVRADPFLFLFLIIFLLLSGVD